MILKDNVQSGCKFGAKIRSHARACELLRSVIDRFWKMGRGRERGKGRRERGRWRDVQIAGSDLAFTAVIHTCNDLEIFYPSD